MSGWVSLGRVLGGFSEPPLPEPWLSPQGQPAAVEEESEEARAAAAVMRAAGCEPEEPYPGRRSSPWRCRCMTCEKIRRPTLHRVS